MHWIERYKLAHRANFKLLYPNAWDDGHYTPPIPPKVMTSNGLTKAIVNYLGWAGAYANRINTMGRRVGGIEITSSGLRLKSDKWIKSTTKSGTPDIDCIINGRPVKIEIKIGRDVQSESQKRSQKMIERAGGKYFIVKTIDEFFQIYDSLKLSDIEHLR
jgi:hypothetical protein